MLLGENGLSSISLLPWLKPQVDGLGAIRQLTWDDVDLTSATIRWRAETDKKGKEWVIPIPAILCDELRSFRVRMGGAFGGLLFPSQTSPDRAASRDFFGHLLAEGEGKAGLSKLDGSLWHAYRRAWATTRKHLPVVDVAAAGGWSDLGTLLKCYQHADHDIARGDDAFKKNHRDCVGRMNA
jgi:integrase